MRESGVVPPEATIADLQGLMAAGEVTARDLVDHYVGRIEAIDRQGPELRSVIEVNPDAHDIAAALDAERTNGVSRGPLHGIPILLKDNIDTADRMLTTAGSLALTGSCPSSDAFVAERLRKAGAVLLGKANLSEWANFRGSHSSSGWSARGGQTRNPYALDRSPCGSSSGSAAAVAADLAPVSLGTETDGSILCPGAICSVVGIKPTVGLTSRGGVIPISHSQDTVGPFGRTVADVAAVLGAITGVDSRDAATHVGAGRHHTDYTRFLDPDGLRGERIGIPRAVYFGRVPEADAAAEEAIRVMQELGAVIVDPADIPSAQEIHDSKVERQVLLYEFKADINEYLRSRPDDQVHTLEDLIRFNEEHRDEELKYFGQEVFEQAQEKGPLTEQAYLDALATSHRLSRSEGIDAVMETHQLDALLLPTQGIPWPIDYETGDKPQGTGATKPAAMAGYPGITVPSGYASGLPLGVVFLGQAFSEPTLIRLAHAYEQATKHRRPPPLG